MPTSHNLQDLFEKLSAPGLMPSDETWYYFMKAAVDCGDEDDVWNLYKTACRKDGEINTNLVNLFIQSWIQFRNLSMKFGGADNRKNSTNIQQLLQKLDAVMNDLKQCNTPLSPELASTLIGGFSKCGDFERLWDVYDSVKKSGKLLTLHGYAWTIAACGSCSRTVSVRSNSHNAYASSTTL